MVRTEKRKSFRWVMLILLTACLLVPACIGYDTIVNANDAVRILAEDQGSLDGYTHHYDTMDYCIRLSDASLKLSDAGSASPSTEQIRAAVSANLLGVFRYYGAWNSTVDASKYTVEIGEYTENSAGDRTYACDLYFLECTEGQANTFGFTAVFTNDYRNVTYSFAAEDGSELPADVMNCLPAAQKAADGEVVSVAGINFNEISGRVNDCDGVWQFTGFDFENQTVNGADIQFIGTWVFNKQEISHSDDSIDSNDGKSNEKVFDSDSKKSSGNGGGSRNSRNFGNTGTYTGLSSTSGVLASSGRSQMETASSAQTEAASAVENGLTESASSLKDIPASAGKDSGMAIAGTSAAGTSKSSNIVQKIALTLGSCAVAVVLFCLSSSLVLDVRALSWYRNKKKRQDHSR